MFILPEIFQFIIGGLLLFYGAEYLIESSKVIASNYNISKIIVGITLVAFGTSLPELIVSIFASLKAESGLVFGNVIGSNIANIGLILGIASIMKPLSFPFKKLRGDLYFLLGITLMPIFSIYFNLMNVNTGILYIFVLGVYSYYLINSDHDVENIEVEEMPYKLLFLTLGIMGLGFGSHFFVEGAVGIAELLAIPSVVIGMTIVAIGTSLPELATTIVAVRKNETSFAIGNVIGSNIMNILAVLGASFIIHPINSISIAVNSQLILMTILTMSLFIAIAKNNKISKEFGVLMTTIYFLFILSNFGFLKIVYHS